jgi:predicted nuclease of predicted toxin-antitoxin system
VKVKLDEGLPVSLAERLAKHGIDADTVFAEKLSGRSDLEVLAAATAEERIVFTLDRGFGNIRAYPPGSHSGIVVFRLDVQSARAVPYTSGRLGRPSPCPTSAHSRSR